MKKQLTKSVILALLLGLLIIIVVLPVACCSIFGNIGCNAPPPDLGPSSSPTLILQIKAKGDTKDNENVMLSIPKFGDNLHIFDSTYILLKFEGSIDTAFLKSDRSTIIKKLTREERLLKSTPVPLYNTDKNLQLVPTNFWLEDFESFIKVKITQKNQVIFQDSISIKYTRKEEDRYGEYATYDTRVISHNHKNDPALSISKEGEDYNDYVIRLTLSEILQL